MTASLSRPSKRTAANANMDRASDLFLITDQDVVYEQDILRNPGSVKPAIPARPAFSAQRAGQ